MLTQVKSVARALDILDMLGNKRRMGLNQLASELGVPKATVHRLLMTLRDRHYIEQDAVTQQYRLGPHVAKLASYALDQYEFRNVIRDQLEALRDLTGETIHLGILAEGEVVYIDRIDTADPIRLACRIGNRDPLHSTAIGKALLAFLPEDEIRTVIASRGLPRFTQNTITDPDMLLQHLALIRERGYALDDEESRIGVRCVGFPVFDRDGKADAAVSVTGPAFRFTRARIADLEAEILAIAAHISASLGYRGS